MKIKFKHPLMLFCLSLFFPLVSFAQGEKNAAYGLLIDNTGSMASQIDNVRNIGRGFVQQKSREGIISVFNFEQPSADSDAVVTSGTAWLQDSYALENFINGIAIARGSTSLYDAILAIAKSTEAKAAAERLAEKSVILLTDGDNSKSKLKQKDLIKELKASGIKVYAIAFKHKVYDFDQAQRIGDATNFLKKITKETGGKVIFPEMKKSVKVEDLITELFAAPAKS